jgi:choline dehydrogenase
MVLANRLSAGGTYSVIVLEAGPDARYVDEINDPFPYNAGLAGNGDYNWRYPTVSQSVGGAAKTISGGKVLGGSTSSACGAACACLSSHPAS